MGRRGRNAGSPRTWQSNHKEQPEGNPLGCSLFKMIKDGTFVKTSPTEGFVGFLKTKQAGETPVEVLLNFVGNLLLISERGTMTESLHTLHHYNLVF